MNDFSDLEVARLKFIMTMNCNFRCDYCFEGGKNPKSLDVDEAISVGKQVLDQIKQPELKVLYFGGEPMLEYHKMKLITQALSVYAKKVGKQIVFTVITNGSILSDDIVKHFNKYKYYVSVSCDGIKEAQQSNRRFAHGDSNTFDRVMNTINVLNAATKDLCISMVVTKDNVKYLSQSFKYFTDNGIRNFAISPVLDDIRYVPDSEVYYQELEKMAYIAKDIPERLVINPPLDVAWDDNNVTRKMTVSDKSVNLEVTPLGVHVIPEKSTIQSIDFSLEENKKTPADTTIRQGIIKAERNASKLYKELKGRNN